MKATKRLTHVILSSIAAGSIATAASAATLPAGYVGLQLGQGHTHYSVSDVTGKNFTVTSAKIDDTKVAGRVFGGYQFNENFATELGYTYYGNTEFKNMNGTAGNNGRIQEYAYDLVVKPILPLQNNFNLYAKGGVAYIRAKTSGNLSHDENKTRPTYGLGLCFDANNNVPVDLSWSRVQNSGNIPNADLFAVGVAYRFDS